MDALKEKVLRRQELTMFARLVYFISSVTLPDCYMTTIVDIVSKRL